MSAVPFSYSRSDNGTETVVVLGSQGVRVVSDSHPNYERVRDLLLSGEADETEVYRYADATTVVLDALRRLSDRVTIRRDALFLDGDEIESRLSKHIVEMIRNGDDNYGGYVAFLENVQANPSKASRKSLFKFLDKHDLVITEDGHFIGYKAVQSNGLSKTAGTEPVTVTLPDGTVEEHTGHIPNPVGAVVEMPRSLVDPEREVACSVGLHIGNYRYARSFGNFSWGDTDQFLTVKVNPRDVVSVPSDSNDEKIRACRYVVVELNSDGTRYQGTSWTPVTESADEDYMSRHDDAEGHCPHCGVTYCDGDC